MNFSQTGQGMVEVIDPGQVVRLGECIDQGRRAKILLDQEFTTKARI